MRPRWPSEPEWLSGREHPNQWETPGNLVPWKKNRRERWRKPEAGQGTGCLTRSGAGLPEAARASKAGVELLGEGLPRGGSHQDNPWLAVVEWPRVGYQLTLLAYSLPRALSPTGRSSNRVLWRVGLSVSACHHKKKRVFCQEMLWQRVWNSRIYLDFLVVETTLFLEE